MANSGATCLSYETVTGNPGKLPLLTPLSEVAGRLSIQAGAKYLEIANGGSGVLLRGVTGVAPANVVVIGGYLVVREPPSVVSVTKVKRPNASKLLVRPKPDAELSLTGNNVQSDTNTHANDV